MAGNLSFQHLLHPELGGSMAVYLDMTGIGGHFLCHVIPMAAQRYSLIYRFSVINEKVPVTAEIDIQILDLDISNL